MCVQKGLMPNDRPPPTIANPQGLIPVVSLSPLFALSLAAFTPLAYIPQRSHTD
jgi:hypothetical protein